MRRIEAVGDRWRFNDDGELRPSVSCADCGMRGSARRILAPVVMHPFQPNLPEELNAIVTELREQHFS